MKRTGTSETFGEKNTCAPSKQSRQEDEPTSSNVAGSSKRLRNEDEFAFSTNATSTVEMLRNNGLPSQNQHLTPIQIRRPTTTSRIDALLEKRDLSLSSPINSGYSTPREAVGVQPASSSSQIGRNGRKIPVMSSDNFMRAIGLFRPLPSNPSSAGLRVPTEPNGQSTSSAAGYGEVKTVVEAPQRPSSLQPPGSSTTRRTSFSTSYQALLGSPVLDEDDQEATANGNGAAEMSTSGYTNTTAPNAGMNLREEERESRPTFSIRRPFTTRPLKKNPQNEVLVRPTVFRLPGSADAASQTDPVLVMSIEEHEAWQEEVYSRITALIREDRVVSPPPIADNGFGIVVDPEQNCPIQSTSIIGQIDGQNPGNVLNNERVNDDEEVASDGEFSDEPIEALKTVAAPPPAPFVDDEQRIVENPEPCDSVHSTSKVGQNPGSGSNNERVDEDEEVAVDGEMNDEPAEALETVATPPSSPIVDDEQKTVENPKKCDLVHSTSQVGQINGQDSKNNSINERAKDDEEVATNVEMDNDEIEAVVTPPRAPKVNNAVGVVEDPVHNVQMGPANVNQDPPSGRYTPEVITIYDDIDGIFEVTLDSDGEEIEERILPNSARVETEFGTIEEIRRVLARLEAEETREGRRHQNSQPAPEAEEELVQQAEENPAQEVQREQVGAQANSESPGLPELEKHSEQAGVPEPEEEQEQQSGEKPQREQAHEVEEGSNEEPYQQEEMEYCRESEPEEEEEGGYEIYRTFINPDGDEEIELMLDNQLLRPPMVGTYKPKEWTYIRVSHPKRSMTEEPSTSSSEPGCSHWNQSGSQPGTSSQPSSSSAFKTPSTSSNKKRTSQRKSRVTRSSLPPKTITRNRRNNADQDVTSSINLANVIGLERKDHTEFLRQRITRSQMTRSTDNDRGSSSSSSNVPGEKTSSLTKVENRRTLALQHKLDSSAPHLHRLYQEKRNCSMFEIEKSRRDRLEYIALTVEQRKEAFKAKTLQIANHSDQKLFFEERVRLERLQESEPTLSKKWFGKSNPKDSAQKRSKLMVSRCLSALNLGFDFMGEYDVADYHRLQDKYPEKLFKNYNANALYTAPEVRNRITDDITFSKDPRTRVPVYSDIAGETPDNIVIPDSLCFDYANENIVDEKTEILLGEAIEESMEEGNQIICDCYQTTPITNCFDNPKCPCFITNKRLRELQGMSTDPAEFHSFKPLVFDNLQPPFHTHVGFACSEFCGCQGECTNNPLFLLKHSVFPMEIYRENAQVGFGIRSTGYIPAGLPVMNFVGEIVDSTRLHPSVRDYCIQLTDIEGDADMYALLQKLNDWTPNFKRKLAELKEREFHIDCKWQGNISRTLNHSCVPNLECLRVFRRSVTPADMRMVLYSLKNISPGEQLTVDYGDEYLTIVDMKCHCQTVACRMGKLFKKFSKFDFKKMAMCFNVFRVDQANAVGSSEAFQNQQFKREDVPDSRREMIVVVNEENDEDEENAGMEDEDQEDAVDAVVDDGQEEDAVENDEDVTE
ncbi:unnamed protein product [Caenorhabditis brenneri]